jgi:DNA topoisomerase-1
MAYAGTGTTIVERLHERGIHRLGSPRRGFRYRGPERRVLNGADRERIEALRIPPAWTNVAINPSPRGAVQAVGKDAAGRWQYLYHESQLARRNRAKQQRLIRFLEALPQMRQAIARDLAVPGIPREKVLAGIMRILSTCFLRPGSEVYADQNGSYGIATLKPGHVSVSGDVVRFDFQGKSGKRQRREISDRRLAPLVRSLLRHPGEVFKFRAPDGSIVDIRRAHINAYIKDVMGEAFSAKDFRTWAGTLLCACALARVGTAPDLSERERKRLAAAAIKEVAEQLGNTPAVCRSSYVLPTVLSGYDQGRVLRDWVDGVADLCRASPRRIERAERALLRLLR